MINFTHIHNNQYDPIAKIIKKKWPGDVIEVMFNGPHSGFIEIADHGMIPISPNDLKFATHNYFQEFCQLLSAANAIPFDPNIGIFSGVAPDGNRVQANIGPSVDAGFAVAIRIVRDFAATWSHFNICHEQAAIIEKALKDEKTILVSGGTSSGKTTLLNLMISHIPKHLRIITVEDKQKELKLDHVNCVKFSVPRVKDNHNAVTYIHIIDSMMRLRPDAMVFGELSIENAFPCLRLMGTGHGSMLTCIHANDPADALKAIKQNMVMSGMSGVSLADVYDILCSRIDLIIQVAKVTSADGKKIERKLTHLVTPSEILDSHKAMLLAS